MSQKTLINVARFASLGIAAGACSATGETVLEESAEQSAPLARENVWDLWPQVGNNHPVSVCYRRCRLNATDPNEVETQAQCDSGKERIEKALRDFARFSRITLPATIGECAHSGDRNPGWIRLNFARPDLDAGGTNTRVRYVNNEKEEVEGAGYPGTGWQLRTSLGTQNNGIIRHEFGHALGFAHEYRRSDEPAGTTCEDDEGVDHTPVSGDVKNLTADYDHESFMNYSYCHDATALSPWDIVGLQAAYGLPFARSIVSQRFGACIGTGTTHTDPLRACDGTNVRIGYNVTGILGTVAGIHRADTPTTVLNVTSSGLQWNSNTKPGTHLSATWKLRKARITGLGDLCLTPGESSSVTMAACNDGLPTKQLWTFDNRSTSQQYKIANVGDPSLCLVSNNGTLKTTSCSASPVPLIAFDPGTGRLRDGQSNKCMVVDGGKPISGSLVKFATCTTKADQQWTIRAQLENSGTAKCLKVASTQMVAMATCSSTMDFTWDIHP